MYKKKDGIHHLLNGRQYIPIIKGKSGLPAACHVFGSCFSEEFSVTALPTKILQKKNVAAAEDRTLGRIIGLTATDVTQGIFGLGNGRGANSLPEMTRILPIHFRLR